MMRLASNVASIGLCIEAVVDGRLIQRVKAGRRASDLDDAPGADQPVGMIPERSRWRVAEFTRKA